MKDQKKVVRTSIGTLSFYWSKGEGPVEPFKGLGKIRHLGWDIPTHWVVDSANVCWACNAHGPNLESADPKDVLALMDDLDQRNAFREVAGLPLEREDWEEEALAHGWEPPAPGDVLEEPGWMRKAKAFGWTVRVLEKG